MDNTSKRTRKLVEIGMLGSVAGLLMVFELPLPFIAPPFYKIDISETAVLIGAFALGPSAGALIELIKIFINLLLNGTQTAFVGEIGNYMIGCSFIIPAAWIYKKHKSKRNALIAMSIGTFFMTLVGCFINAYLLLPAYSTAFGMSLDQIVDFGTAVNGGIHDIKTFVLIAVAPFNLLKGIVVSGITALTYKHISPVLKRHL